MSLAHYAANLAPSSSLFMHVLAEEIPEDGIFKLNSPSGSGKGCLLVGFKLKYFNNAIHVFAHTNTILQIFRRRKFWRFSCNSPNSPKFSPSKILYHTVDVGFAPPCKQHPYRANPIKSQYLRKEIEYMLKNNIIECPVVVNGIVPVY